MKYISFENVFASWRQKQTLDNCADKCGVIWSLIAEIKLVRSCDRIYSNGNWNF